MGYWALKVNCAAAVATTFTPETISIFIFTVRTRVPGGLAEAEA
jgi:hypothetical protein